MLHRSEQALAKAMWRDRDQICLKDGKPTIHPAHFGDRFFARDGILYALDHGKPELTPEQLKRVCAVAWFEQEDGAGGRATPILLSSFRPLADDHSKAIVTGKTIDEAARRASKTIRAEFDRGEAVSEQLKARASELRDTLQPLTNLYSEPQLAEIRKRCIGRGVPELFYDWLAAQFYASSPPRLPTKGDAHDHCGPGTLIGNQLAAAGCGISKQRLAHHLGVIRAALEESGMLARKGPGKARARAIGYTIGDNTEDINQPTPAESAEDSDDWRA